MFGWAPVPWLVWFQCLDMYYTRLRPNPMPCPQAKPIPVEEVFEVPDKVGGMRHFMEKCY